MNTDTHKFKHWLIEVVDTKWGYDVRLQSPGGPIQKFYIPLNADSAGHARAVATHIVDALITVKVGAIEMITST